MNVICIKRTSWLLLIGPVLILAGCAESVDTRLSISHPFSVFGIINPQSDTHAVRIFEIQSNIQLIQPDPIDAVVTTTLMQTGEKRLWRESFIQLPDGDYRHVYWDHFPALGGETYRLEVTRSDGETTSAITTVPDTVSLKVQDPDPYSLRVLMPLLISGHPASLPRIDVEYIVVGFEEEGSQPFFKSISFNYAGRSNALRETPDGLVLEIDMAEDHSTIYTAFDQDSNVTPDIIDLREIKVNIHVGDANWVSPAGVFDPDALVEPGTFSNVENGFGYFGSGYITSIAFRPPLDLIRRAGFHIPGEN